MLPQGRWPGIRENPTLLLKKAERRYRLQTGDYERLAAFRRALRGFLRFSEEAAEGAGLTTQHYQAMLILRAADEGEPVTIAALAHELLIKHNSAVGLVDRLVGEGLATRKPSSADRRKVELKLSTHGREVLAKLAAVHRAELQRVGPALRRLVGQVSRK
jgi:DNA-binding MarR family transcriptional regulator